MSASKNNSRDTWNYIVLTNPRQVNEENKLIELMEKKGKSECAEMANVEEISRISKI